MPPNAAAADPTLLSTGEMARITGNTLRTVRFYEEAGMLAPERRSPGGHRLFSRRELDRLQLITDLREAGLSLEQIRELFAIKERGAGAASAASALVAAIDRQLAALTGKMAVLARLKDELGAARRILGDCCACTEAGFPGACESCGKLARHGALPTAMRALWSVDGAQRGAEKVAR